MRLGLVFGGVKVLRVIVYEDILFVYFIGVHEELVRLVFNTVFSHY